MVTQSSSIADAASTAIANACFVEDGRVRQAPAEKLDPNTDLIGIPVTVGVEELEPEKYARYGTSVPKGRDSCGKRDYFRSLDRYRRACFHDERDAVHYGPMIRPLDRGVRRT